MKIKDVMNKDVIICKPDDTLGNLADLLKKNHISGLPVVDKGKVVGLVSETDLLKLFKIPEISNELWLPSPFEIIEIPIRNLVKIEETKKAFENIKLQPVKDIMTKTIHAISPQDDLEDASKMMVRYNVNRLPVIDNGKLVGIVARRDILKGLSGSME
ncbi:MAG TPA: CBS domain-containing protein [Candidatus Limnocylindrales bacterium]|nr:CBS domain-containing protein [Candidatus Limnocylindrales bacterium]